MLGGPAVGQIAARDPRFTEVYDPASVRRERMTVRLSKDEGASWPVSRVLHEGPAAYSSLVALPDRSIGLLFERGARTPYETIAFARITLAWLTGGTDR